MLRNERRCRRGFGFGTVFWHLDHHHRFLQLLRVLPIIQQVVLRASRRLLHQERLRGAHRASPGRGDDAGQGLRSRAKRGPTGHLAPDTGVAEAQARPSRQLSRQPPGPGPARAAVPGRSRSERPGRRGRCGAETGTGPHVRFGRSQDGFGVVPVDAGVRPARSNDDVERGYEGGVVVDVGRFRPVGEAGDVVYGGVHGECDGAVFR